MILQGRFNAKLGCVLCKHEIYNSLLHCFISVMPNFLLIVKHQHAGVSQASILFYWIKKSVFHTKILWI